MTGAITVMTKLLNTPGVTPPRTPPPEKRLRRFQELGIRILGINEIIWEIPYNFTNSQNSDSQLLGAPQAFFGGVRGGRSPPVLLNLYRQQ